MMAAEGDRPKNVNGHEDKPRRGSDADVAGVAAPGATGPHRPTRDTACIDEAVARLAGVRRDYEPALCALADRLYMPVPRWAPSTTGGR